MGNHGPRGRGLVSPLIAVRGRRLRRLPGSRLDLTRAQILAFRRQVGALDERLPRGRRSLRRAAWAGLQDSVPRAALLSIHARVEGTEPSTWEDSSLVQLWGPRHHAYVVAAGDVAAFDALRRWLTPVRTSVGDAWILSSDEPTFRAGSGPAAPARLLPSGDAYFLLQGDDRKLLVPDGRRRAALWTPRVWPGGVPVEGEIVGTWRRALGTVAIQTWRRISRAARDAVEAEAASLPLPDVQRRSAVRWDA